MPSVAGERRCEKLRNASYVIAEQNTSELSESVRLFLRFEQEQLWKAERYRHSGCDLQLDGKYLPEHRRVFELPCFLLPRRALYVYGQQRDEDAGQRIIEGDKPEDRALFLVHPAEVERYRVFLSRAGATDAAAEGVHLWATPTSSGRTLLVWPHGTPDHAFFAKLSVNSRALGDRRLRRANVASSIGLSQLLQRFGSELPRGMTYLSETLGLVPRLMPDAGFIVRPMPHEIKSDQVIVAPVFSLMGGNAKSRPLLLQLMELERAGAREILENILLANFAEVWVDLVFEFGLIIEAHAQDLLLALSSRLVPLGTMYYRDFEGLAVDWELRRARCLPSPEGLPHAFEWFETYETWGYPLYQLVSTKITASLFDYLNLVLGELEAALIEWQTAGLIDRKVCWEGELTGAFSSHLRRAIQRKFGVREAEDYNIRHQLRRFVKFLMEVRREFLLRRA